jgi:hypothetical protein
VAEPAGGRRVRFFTVLAVVLIVLATVLIRLWSGGRPVQKPPTPGTPDRETAIVLLVLSGRDGRPLSDAVLSDGSANVKADAEGRIALAPGVRSGVVRCPGHVGRRLDLKTAGEEQKVWLLPVGAVEISFLDGADKPVPGVEVELEPASDPVDDDNFLSAPLVRERRSDGEGRVVWAEVVPGRPYRWRVKSSQRVEADPPEVVEPGLYVPTPKSGPFVSSPIEAPMGETLRLKARVRAGATVSGIVESAVPGGYGLVRIHSIREYLSGPKPDRDRPQERTIVKLERVATPGEGGRFQLSDLSPGRKRLTAHWTSSRGIQFASVQFDLQAGEIRDLGVLRGQDGQDFSLTVRVAGRDAIPKDVQDRGLKAKVRMISRRGGGPGTAFDEWLLLNVDEPRALTGLAGGPLLFDAEIADPEQTPGVVWKGDRGQFDLSADKEGVLTLEARATRKFTLKAVYPAGQAGGALNAFVFPVGGSEARPEGDAGYEIPSFRPRAGDAPGTASTVFDATAGEVLIRVFSADPGKPESPGLFGEVSTRIAAEGPSEAQVVLGPGNTLRGKVVNRRGMPDRRLLRLLVDPYRFTNDLPVRTVSPDEAGRFVIRGVPPGKLMTFLFADGEFMSGPAGAETLVDVKLEQ